MNWIDWIVQRNVGTLRRPTWETVATFDTEQEAKEVYNQRIEARNEGRGPMSQSRLLKCEVTVLETGK